jgi:hypothetical protein
MKIDINIDKSQDVLPGLFLRAFYGLEELRKGWMLRKT